MPNLAITVGTFDLFHLGHLFLMKQCRKIAGPDGLVFAGVNTDDFVEQYKGKAPWMPYAHRAGVMEQIVGISNVYPYEHTDCRQWLLALQREAGDLPTFLVIGDDWAAKDYYKQMGFTQDWLNANDISLVYVPRVGDWSSTALKGRQQ